MYSKQRENCLHLRLGFGQYLPNIGVIFKGNKFNLLYFYILAVYEVF